ncbi:MAG: glycerophosphodiester phosphodiesterase [Micromonosporaceae bacterium]|nr:glycerophosphodiester phosphodiesterase [Micromonosporaceae bacterium]
MLAVAHRAGNDLADLRAALDAGVDLVEADIHLFRGALEVRHCKALGRHLFWEKWWDVSWRRDVIVPELAEVLAHVREVVNGDPRLMLDLKGRAPAVAPEVAALLRRAAPGMPVSVCTKQWRMLDAFDGDPHVRKILSASSTRQLGRLRARLRRRRAAGVSVRRQLLTPAVAEELRRGADVVMVWPVDTEAALDHARWLGVNGVISKNLDILRQLVHARG